MSVDEARRIALHDAAAHNRWDEEAALTLMELLPPSGWGDVTRRSDLDALEQRMDLRFRLVDQRFEALETEIDRRFAAVDARFDTSEARIDSRLGSFEAQIDARLGSFEARMDSRLRSFEARIEDHVDARIERALNRSLRWTIGTMLTLTGVATALATAIAHLT